MEKTTTITRESWGLSRSGVEIELWTLATASLIVRLTNHGATVVGIDAPDREGNAADVVLGYDSAAGYEADRCFLGATIGRYANRIADGKFRVDGQEYEVPTNSGVHSLHSGPMGFDKQVWQATEVENGVEFLHVSPDGHQGFPGEVHATVRFTVEAGSLRIDYTAVTNRPTPVAMTNHTYFNLTGDARQSVLGHTMVIEADEFTPTDATMIPTGEIAPVDGTPLEFRMPQLIGARIDDPRAETAFAGGYDHNYVLRPHRRDELFLAAQAADPRSGRVLTVHTTEPGMQFYSGNYLDGSVGKGGVPLLPRTGFCVETQHYPDSPNHAEFPNTVLRPGEKLRSTTIFRFGVQR